MTGIAGDSSSTRSIASAGVTSGKAQLSKAMSHASSFRATSISFRQPACRA